MGRGVICSFTYSMSLDPLAFAEMDVVRTIEGFFLGGFLCSAIQFEFDVSGRISESKREMHVVRAG